MYKQNVTEPVPTFSSQFVNTVALAPTVACSVVCKTCSTVAFWATWFVTQHSVIIRTTFCRIKRKIDREASRILTYITIVLLFTLDGLHLWSTRIFNSLLYYLLFTPFQSWMVNKTRLFFFQDEINIVIFCDLSFNVKKDRNCIYQHSGNSFRPRLYR